MVLTLSLFPSHVLKTNLKSLFVGLPEWKKVIPKRQEQLDQEAKEKKPDDKESKGPQAWSDEDLRLNL